MPTAFAIIFLLCYVRSPSVHGLAANLIGMRTNMRRRFLRAVRYPQNNETIASPANEKTKGVPDQPSN
jgi:hypothetical protein